MSIELATAYVSLQAETTKLEQQVKQAFSGMGNQADAAGKDIGTRMARTAAKALSDGWRPDQNILAGIPDTKLDRIGAHIGRVIGKGIVVGTQAKIVGKEFGESFMSGAGSVGFGRVIAGWSDDLKGQSNKLGYVAGKTFSAGLQLAVGAGITGATMIITKGFERLSRLDDARARLEVLNKSAAKFGKPFIDVQKTIQDVTDSFTGTRYSLDAGFELAVNAIGSGVKDIKTYMDTVADAAEFGNTSLEEMGDIFQKIVRDSGTFGREILNQLDLRIPASSWIMESAKLTNEQFEDMVKKGQVSLDMLQQAIEDHAPGMAKAASNTLSGAIDQMQTAIARVGADFLSALFGGDDDPAKGLKDAINEITRYLNDLDRWINDHRQEIRDFFNAAKDTATNLLNVLGKILDYLKEHPGAIQAVVTAFIAWEGITGLATVVTALGSISTAMRAMPALATAALGPLGLLAGALFVVADARSQARWGNGDPVGPIPSADDFTPGKRTTAEIMLGPWVGPWVDRTFGNGGNAPSGSAATQGNGFSIGSAGAGSGAMSGSPGRGFPLPFNGGFGIGSAGSESGAMASGQGAALNWATIDAIAASRGLTMTSGYRDPNGPTLGGVPAWRSYHGSGRAHDFAGTPAQNAAFYNFMKATYGSRLKELLYEDVGTSNEHVHVAFASGGPVSGPGTATSDSIPAMLSTGEHVLTAKDVAAMGGQNAVYNFRNALHRAGGGAAWPIPLTSTDWAPGINIDDNELLKPQTADSIAQRDTLTGMYNPDVPGHLNNERTPVGDAPSAGQGVSDRPGNFDPNMKLDTSNVNFEDTRLKPFIPFISPGNERPLGVAGSLTRFFPGDIMNSLWQARLANTDWSMTQIPSAESVRKDPEANRLIYGDPNAPDQAAIEESRNKLQDALDQRWLTDKFGNQFSVTTAWGKFAEGGAVDPLLQALDPNGHLSADRPPTDQPMPPMPATPDQLPAQQQPTDQQTPSDLLSSNRSQGFVPTAAGNTGVAGTSSLSALFDLGNQAVGSAIDMGAQIAGMAASAAAAGAGAPGSGAAANVGIQIGASIAKRGAKLGFDLLGIGTDALIAQLFPFGAPRWIGYDYTNFVPQSGPAPKIGVTTGEKAINSALEAGNPQLRQPQTGPGVGQNVFGGNVGALPGPAPAAPPIDPAQQPGGPVQSETMAGAQKPITENQSDLPPWMTPLGQFDQGGMLPPGGMGINLTKRPEPVLTPQQWDALAAAQPAGRGDGPLVKIDAIYGLSAEDVATQIESKQRLAMMRYAGRP